MAVLQPLLRATRLDTTPRGIAAAAGLIRRFDKRAIGALTGPLDALEVAVLQLLMRHLLRGDEEGSRVDERALLRAIEDTLHLMPSGESSLARDLLVIAEYGPRIHGPRHALLTELDSEEQQNFLRAWAGDARHERRATWEILRHLVLHSAWSERDQVDIAVGETGEAPA